MATPTSSQQAAAGNGTAKTGGKKRHVASQAGVKRYGKPIGSEIGGARDANHAAIQQDQGARKNYQGLISGDAVAQRKALDGMGVDDLNKLADIAFSFKSSNPQVVALRIAARNAQARRGIRVKAGQTQTYPGGKKPPSVNYNNRGATKALSGVGDASRRLIELTNATAERDKAAGRGTTGGGSFPINNVAQLRDAMRAIGRAKPESRPAVARHIIAKARELKAEHMVSDAIRHYARGSREPGTVGMSRAEADAIELAGKWKHGYIPLDAVAMASKMKGGHGKKWWDGPGHSSGGGGAKKALHGSPKSGSPGTGQTNAQLRARVNRGEGLTGREREQLHGSGGGAKRTTVVKSGSAESKTRGAAVTEPSRNVNKVVYNKTTDRYRAIDPETGSAHRAASGKPHEFTTRQAAEGFGRPQDTTGKSKLAWASDYKTAADVHQAVLAKKITPAQGNTLLEDLGRAKAPKSRTIPDKPKVGTTSATDVNKVSSGSPAELAQKYVQMHGAEGTRKKIAQLEARKTLTARDRASLAALKAAVSGGGPGKA